MATLKNEFPSLGWKQILTARKEILDWYDRAREQARSHEVETYHGRVAEAEVRKWLLGFLPKRYGVTSGYIISPGLSSAAKAPHFDVIIYDSLESPVLWIEGSPDSSTQGASLAIPVEYVRAVLEVKAQLSAANVKHAVEHLGDLKDLMSGLDALDEPYKLYLPADFCCGVLCVELHRDHAAKEATLASFVEDLGLRGYFGGVVLRGETHTLPHTGRIALTNSNTAMDAVLPGDSPLLEFGLSKTTQIDDQTHVGAMITWSESNFSQFAFDLIAMMRGKYDSRRISSFYGMGSSFHELMKLAKDK